MLYLKLQKVIQVHDLYEKVVNDCIAIAVGRRFGSCLFIVQGSQKALVSQQVENLRLYGQAIKRTWWMPWQLEAMKDVVDCDKSRGAVKQALIREFPNGETHLIRGIIY